MAKIIYPELSYTIVGILFEVYNKLGYGLKEKSYQVAIATNLEELKIPFKQQLPVKFIYKGKVIRKLFLDFIIDDKIILEIKATDYFNKENITQIYEYLKFKGKKLGIIANFTKRGIRSKRIIYKDD